MNAAPVLSIIIASIFTNNILLASFLGLCSFIAVSNRIETAMGLGIAVTFVMVFTTAINYSVYYYLLIPLNLEFLSSLIFIAVIAAFVQFLEMFIERFSPALYYSLGIFLPLITVNCAILGAVLFMVIRKYNFIQSVGFGFGSGVGWAFAILLMAGLRKKMRYSKVPAALEGPGVILIITGVIAMTFIGFTGILNV